METLNKPAAVEYYSLHLHFSFLRIWSNLKIKLNKLGATGIKRKFGIVF